MAHIGVLEQEDGSTLIEWIFDSKTRFGISLEPDASESSWYFVSLPLEAAENGLLPPILAAAPKLLEALRTWHAFAYHYQLCVPCQRGQFWCDRGRELWIAARQYPMPALTATGEVE